MIHCYDTAKNDHHPSLSAVVFRIKFIAVEQKSPPASIRPTVLVLLMYPFCASSIDLKTYINSKWLTPRPVCQVCPPCRECSASHLWVHRGGTLAPHLSTATTIGDRAFVRHTRCNVAFCSVVVARNSTGCCVLTKSVPRCFALLVCDTRSSAIVVNGPAGGGVSDREVSGDNCTSVVGEWLGTHSLHMHCTSV